MASTLGLAIDPGPKQSAILKFDGERPTLLRIASNYQVAMMVREDGAHLAIEMIESFGMAVGKDVFETVFWIGRFCECATNGFTRIGRKEVKMHLCNSMRAKDTNIRQALLDRFPATGGGANPQVGTKAQPGPLYGIKSHLWSALAVAVTWWDTKRTA